MYLPFGFRSSTCVFVWHAVQSVKRGAFAKSGPGWHSRQVRCACAYDGVNVACLNVGARNERRSTVWHVAHVIVANRVPCGEREAWQPSHVDDGAAVVRVWHVAQASFAWALPSTNVVVA